jgi:hypothetical protein
VLRAKGATPDLHGRAPSLDELRDVPHQIQKSILRDPVETRAGPIRFGPTFGAGSPSEAENGATTHESGLPPREAVALCARRNAKPFLSPREATARKIAKCPSSIDINTHDGLSRLVRTRRTHVELAAIAGDARPKALPSHLDGIYPELGHRTLLGNHVF